MQPDNPMSDGEMPKFEPKVPGFVLDYCTSKFERWSVERDSIHEQMNEHIIQQQGKIFNRLKEGDARFEKNEKVMEGFQTSLSTLAESNKPFFTRKQKKWIGIIACVIILPILTEVVAESIVARIFAEPKPKTEQAAPVKKPPENENFTSN